MTMRTGTHDISILLAVTNQSVLQYGLERVNDVLRADLAAHNVLVDQLIGELCEVTTDRGRAYGASVDGEMKKIDEYGRGPTRRPSGGGNVDFPMFLHQFAAGYTATFFRRATPADLARVQIAAQQAHLRAIQRAIKEAFFKPTNRSVRDIQVDNYLLTVRALVNADSQPIPNGPNGETFTASTHTHYNGSATLTNTAVQDAITDVVEHGHGADVRVYIARANEAAFRLLTDFVAYLDPRVRPASTERVGDGALDRTRQDNRAIGVFGPAEVWVKPWVPANYQLVTDVGDPRKPLAFRNPARGQAGLFLAADLDTHPLYAEYYEAEFGVGANNRTNGAVNYSANATYAEPTF